MGFLEIMFLGCSVFLLTILMWPVKVKRIFKEGEARWVGYNGTIRKMLVIGTLYKNYLGMSWISFSGSKKYKFPEGDMFEYKVNDKIEDLRYEIKAELLKYLYRNEY